MTVICGLVKDDASYIAADSCSSCCGGKNTLAQPKIFRQVIQTKYSGNINVLVGHSGLARQAQLWHYGFTAPVFNDKDQCLLHYLVNDFSLALRDCFRKFGELEVNNSIERVNISSMLLMAGSIFYLDRALFIGNYAENFLAIGSGEDVASGSLFTTQKFEDSPETRMDPLRRVILAAEAGCYFTTTCAPPIHTLVEPAQKDLEIKIYDDDEDTKD